MKKPLKRGMEAIAFTSIEDFVKTERKGRPRYHEGCVGATTGLHSSIPCAQPASLGKHVVKFLFLRPGFRVRVTAFGVLVKIVVYP